MGIADFLGYVRLKHILNPTNAVFAGLNQKPVVRIKTTHSLIAPPSWLLTIIVSHKLYSALSKYDFK